MNSNKPRRVGGFVRVSAVTAGMGILIAVMSGCQTPREAMLEEPTVPSTTQQQSVPAGIDRSRPVDRIVEQLERMKSVARENSARFAGVPADRVERMLAREREAQTNPTRPGRSEGKTADRIERLLPRTPSQQAQ